MPYIITATYTRSYHPLALDDDATPCASTSCAAATLDEARNIAHKIVHGAYSAAYPILPRGLGGEHSDAQRAHFRHSSTVTSLSEDGGTIGPLPDGTVIKVRRVTFIALRGLCGAERGACLSATADETRANVITAYNARSTR